MALHVTPDDDLKPHELESTCPCNPRLELENGEMIFIHNSYDGRENYEKIKAISEGEPSGWLTKAVRRQKERQFGKLKYGQSYFVWKDSNMIGVGVWIDDKHNGECFLIHVEGQPPTVVFDADKWEKI